MMRMLRQVIDRMLWLSFESSINTFRRGVLGLEPIRVGEGGWNMLNLNRVSEWVC